MADYTKELKAVVEIENIRFYSRDKNWGIVVCSIDKVLNGTPAFDDRKQITVKGVMAEPNIGGVYNLKGTLVNDAKWGMQYDIVSFCASVPLTTDDKTAQKKYISSLYTPREVEKMYHTLDNPYEVLYNKDTQSLVQISGCGLKVAHRWIHRFHTNLNIAKILLELPEYNLTNNMISKLLKKYSDPELVIEKVKKNPYALMEEVDGIGWKTADKIALDGGLSPWSEERIGGFIIYYLRQCGENGRSWIEPDELLGAILENLGEDVPDFNISITIQNLGDKLWKSDDKTKIGLMRYFNLEMRIAEELIRLRDAESKIDSQEYIGWEDKIKKQEELQGWEFTEEQKRGIELSINNNIMYISGAAGCGKTSLVTGFLKILGKYDTVQAALSGRAASRMAEITGEEGHTIHRLLGYPCNDDNAKNGFFFHQDNKMPHTVYVIDEISMIGLELFYYLLRAIPSGSKVLLIGDYGQLESIGSGNIAFDILHSESIPSVLLTKIHRQAAKSGIISESTKVRDGIQLVEKDWIGEEIRGELQDLKIKCFLDKSNTYYEVIKAFSKELNDENFNIYDHQIIVPIKKRGTCNTYELNNAIQELYNDNSDGKKAEVPTYRDGKNLILRVGDKVINRVNNYRTIPPIYNGNIGIIKRFEETYDEDTGKEHNYMVIDFDGIGEVKVLEEYWKNIDLAYALTTHRTQGSEWDTVIFGFDFSAFSLLTKELVYTGITRAKKKCYLIAQNKALRYATTHSEVKNKQTHLQRCLHDQAHPVFIFNYKHIINNDKRCKVWHQVFVKNVEFR